MRTTTLSAATRRTVLLGAGAALAAPHVAKAQTSYRAAYKLSVVGNRPIPLSEGAFHWAELATQRSGGRVNVKDMPTVLPGVTPFAGHPGSRGKLHISR